LSSQSRERRSGPSTSPRKRRKRKRLPLRRPRPPLLRERRLNERTALENPQQKWP